MSNVTLEPGVTAEQPVTPEKPQEPAESRFPKYARQVLSDVQNLGRTIRDRAGFAPLDFRGELTELDEQTKHLKSATEETAKALGVTFSEIPGNKNGESSKVHSVKEDYSELHRVERRLSHPERLSSSEIDEYKVKATSLRERIIRNYEVAQPAILKQLKADFIDLFQTHQEFLLHNPNPRTEVFTNLPIISKNIMILLSGDLHLDQYDIALQTLQAMDEIKQILPRERGEEQTVKPEKYVESREHLLSDLQQFPGNIQTAKEMITLFRGNNSPDLFWITNTEKLLPDRKTYDTFLEMLKQDEITTSNEFIAHDPQLISLLDDIIISQLIFLRERGLYHHTEESKKAYLEKQYNLGIEGLMKLKKTHMPQIPDGEIAVITPSFIEDELVNELPIALLSNFSGLQITPPSKASKPGLLGTSDPNTKMLETYAAVSIKEGEDSSVALTNMRYEYMRVFRHELLHLNHEANFSVDELQMIKIAMQKDYIENNNRYLSSYVAAMEDRSKPATPEMETIAVAGEFFPYRLALFKAVAPNLYPVMREIIISREDPSMRRNWEYKFDENIRLQEEAWARQGVTSEEARQAYFAQQKEVLEPVAA